MKEKGLVKMNLFCGFSLLLFSFSITQGKISEYQLESEIRSPCEQVRGAGVPQQRDYVPQCSEDGRYRYVQCSHGGECWCVNADGAEVLGSRQNRSVVYCLTSCQLQRQKALQGGNTALLPQCSDSGEYHPIQCDNALAQCWCVDLDGMEIYGTRQNGRPSQCPGICKVRERRLLHGVGEPSPPQCSHDDSFLPVQCKFINITNMMVFDMLHTFNRRPEVFQTFSGFRKAFPELSSYCYCADTRGRELPNTGVELLLDEVYDTAFSGLDAGQSFSQSNMYRILQRRYRAVQLALTGRFRCPSPCESERSASLQAGNVFVPSCDARGDYMPTQCQAGGQCWCVDSTGKEIFGSRQQGVPDCGAGVGDCLSKRRQALSRLFYGPAGHLIQNDMFSTAQANAQKDVFPLALCSPEFQELLANSGLTRSLSDLDLSDVGDVVAELIQGIFPSGALALKAISLTTNPKRLQENLFGGMFLKNIGRLNFTGTVGTRGTLSFSQIFNQVGLAQGSMDLEELAKIFSNNSVNLDREISDMYGRIVNLKRNRDLMKIIGTILETEQFYTMLRVAITLLKAEDNTQLGPLFQTMFQTFEDCGSVVFSPYVPQCTEDGQYEEVQCQGLECWCVNSQGLEVMGSRSSGARPRCPSQCEKERTMAIAIKASRSAGSEVFIPKCEKYGEYTPLQCLGKNCFCIGRNGAMSNTLSSGATLQCPTDCQITASQYFLNTINSILAGSTSILHLSDVYIPRCTSDGGWHQIQCDGPPEKAFEFYEEWKKVNNDGKQLPVSELLGILQEYAKNSNAMVSFRGFLSALFQAGHQKVFPALAKFETFSAISSKILDGNTEVISGPSVFLNPLYLWSLLRGDSKQYPGPLTDFSVPLGHFNLRKCWCVDQKGDMVTDSKAAVNQVPKCPGSCSLVQSQVDKFLAEAETLISLSNSSHVPVGYSFLLAESIRLSANELQQVSGPGFQVAELLQNPSSSALHLAAHSTLHFYWQSSQMSSERDRESLALGYQPYRPQCDAYGQWLPSQCHPSTGYCWCVNGEGGYISGSLSARFTQRRHCQTTCQRSQARSVISDWTESPSSMNLPYSPSCDEDGGFSVLQRHEMDSAVASCVSPVTGQIIQQATPDPTGDLACPGWCALQKKQAADREEGVGYEPECVQAGQRFSPQQCDDVHCWCVSENGRELPSTRSRRSSVKTPSCNTPECPLPFGDSVSHGAVLCANVSVSGEQRQRCKVWCHQGYASPLPVNSFMCDPMTKMWLANAPLSYACQRVQPLQTVQASIVLHVSLVETQQGCHVQSSALQASLLYDMRAAGVCSLQLSPGQHSSLSLCDESSVSLECVSEQSLTAHITFKAQLSDLPANALPDLHDIETIFSSEKMRDGVMKIMWSGVYQSVFIPESLPPVSFGCSMGYQLLPDSAGCVACPAGSFYSAGRCEACPLGSYQAEAGQDLCSACPSGTSTMSPGASSPSHCVSKCQQSRLNCSEKGDFLSAQKHFLSGRWLCVNQQGEELSWTSADEPITAEQCQVLERFEAPAASSLLLDSVDAVVLRSDSSPLPLELQLRQCVLDCARDDSCQHVAVFREGDQTVCDLYSTSSANVQCRGAQQSRGFLGNEEADTFQTLSCLLKVKVGAKPDLTVVRKKGHEFNTAGEKSFDRLSFLKASSGVYRTVVFQTPKASLANAHRFCADTCSQESCCDGFLLNQNVFNGGSVMCGLLSFPAVLQCSEEDWDLSAVASSSRICGAGLRYDKQQMRFTFDFGGQNFTITDTALPTSSKNEADYQASIIGFQRVYLWTESDMSTRPKAEGACKAAVLLETPKPTGMSNESFDVLDNSNIRIDSAVDTSRQQYWLFKHQFTSEEAQIWCLQRCSDEELCHVADLRDEGPVYFACILYPNTHVCGAYDTKPLRQSCSLVLPQEVHVAYQKKVDLAGSVENFYSRVPFQKMVSYSVRSLVNVSSKPITEGFFECERRCDEDPCCRGIGYIKDTDVPGSDVLCLTLNSLGIQTCGEDMDTRWRVQNCSPSAVQTGPYPFGWYEKPVNQWTRSPAICPSFRLRSPSRTVHLKDWKQLDASSVLVDSSVSAFDIVHISRDIGEDLESVRNWCLAACEEDDSCLIVTLSSRDSAVRCVMYPDSQTCFHSGGQHCVLLIKEPAQYVYLRTVLKPVPTSVSIPGHGTLLGEKEMKRIGAESKSVTYYLGVPYARPPIGQLRFSPPQAADWTGIWNATFARPSCIQPGDTADFNTSEDCLYLNIFVPSSMKGAGSVLVFFHNPASGLLDGSYLAAVGNVVVVTASFRVAAYGFLSAGSSVLPGNFGLQDQAVALRWVQENIVFFQGDPNKVTIGADRNGADIASLHLISSSSSSSSLFHQALLMGGSVFSPAVVMTRQKAQAQAASLGTELGCSSSEPTQLLTCLRERPAESINAAQTKLLAVSGPLEAWSPVVDGVVVAEEPSVALRVGSFPSVPLLLGSSAEDGLISRAKNIKNFEQLQGRADSKSAFYEALSNSLGGEDANVFVKEAATWFYSLHHSPTPAGYDLFSQALDNATRDFFITCPSVTMASFWASNTRSSVYMYHLPGDMTHTSIDLSSPLDVQYVFGMPHVSGRRDLFTSTERTLSLQIMSYIANFIKSGNPNLLLSVSATSFGEVLPPWPQFLPHPSGQNYKELSPALSNRKGLQAPQCSFWSQYVPALSSSTGTHLCRDAMGKLGTSPSPAAEPQPVPLSDLSVSVPQSPPMSGKDAYN